MNEVETFARAGETAGAALGTGVQAAREGVSRASRQLADQVSEHGTVGRAARDAGAAAQTALVERLETAQQNLPEQWAALQRNFPEQWAALQRNFPEQWAALQQNLPEQWDEAQRLLADRVTGARRELAARLQPAPPPAPVRRARRWPWVLLLLASVGSAVAAVVLARRPQPIDQPASGTAGTRQGDPNAPHGNGVVGADDPSVWRE